MQIAKKNRKKLDPKSKKCIFIGYSLHSKGYRLYDPKRRQFHESRDVIFVENEFGVCLQKKEANGQNVETPVISQPDICIDDSEHETEDEGTLADMQIDPGANGQANQNFNS